MPQRPAYLRRLRASVRPQFAAAVDLRTFLRTTGTLTLADRERIVRQALVLVGENYAHLPLKRAMHSIDPVQRLKLLLQSIQQLPAAAQPSEVDFHREMTDIFTSLRDLHTNYLLPHPFDAMTAFLPFMVEDFVEQGTVRYLVSHVVPGFSHPTFEPGVEILYWNGMPIARAVMANAQRYAGSNREARHARGVQTLTTRALVVAAPPDEEWVIVRYRSKGGEQDIRFDWMVNHLPGEGGGDAAHGRVPPAAFASLGLDLEQDAIQRMRKVLFKPDVVAAQERARAKARRRDRFGALESALPHVFEARPVRTPSGTFGYVRIRTFNHWPADAFVNEFVRLVAALPGEGLIVDVRGNGGGVIMNGERLLQTLTPRTIEPEPVQFLNTALNLRICQRHDASSPWADLGPWVPSMTQALQTGAAFSAGYPISTAEECNAIGQKYFGPVVLVVDALCYSTTDIFAAGFQDHDIGLVLGVDGNTGAGGANVWTHDQLVRFVLPGKDSCYQPLPSGAGMRVSIRRTLRVGRRAGTPVEDLGVVPDARHELTRADLLEENVDMIGAAAALLKGKPARRFDIRVHVTSATAAEIVAETRGVTRIDVFAGGRPVHSADIRRATTTLAVASPAPLVARTTVQVLGFDAGTLVARVLITL